MTCLIKIVGEAFDDSETDAQEIQKKPGQRSMVSTCSANIHIPVLTPFVRIHKASIFLPPQPIPDTQPLLHASNSKQSSFRRLAAKLVAVSL